MQTILVTNNGPHSAADWASATASHLVAIAQDAAPAVKAQAVKLEAAVIDILEGHHGTVQAGERQAVASDLNRMVAPIAPADHLNVDAAVAEIVAAAAQTPWAAAFATPEAQAGIKTTLTSHFGTSMQIERSWAADRNPTHPAAVAFRAQFHSGVAQ